MLRMVRLLRVPATLLTFLTSLLLVASVSPARQVLLALCGWSDFSTTFESWSLESKHLDEPSFGRLCLDPVGFVLFTHWLFLCPQERALDLFRWFLLYVFRMSRSSLWFLETLWRVRFRRLPPRLCFFLPKPQSIDGTMQCTWGFAVQTLHKASEMWAWFCDSSIHSIEVTYVFGVTFMQLSAAHLTGNYSRDSLLITYYGTWQGCISKHWREIGPSSLHIQQRIWDIPVQCLTYYGVTPLAIQIIKT